MKNIVFENIPDNIRHDMMQRGRKLEDSIELLEYENNSIISISNFFVVLISFFLSKKVDEVLKIDSDILKYLILAISSYGIFKLKKEFTKMVVKMNKKEFRKLVSDLGFESTDDFITFINLPKSQRVFSHEKSRNRKNRKSINRV